MEPRSLSLLRLLAKFVEAVSLFDRSRLFLQSAKKLKKKCKVEVLDSNLVIADVTTPGLLEAAMEGMESVVLCTSAVPKVLHTYFIRSRRDTLIPWGSGGVFFPDRGSRYRWASSCRSLQQ